MTTDLDSQGIQHVVSGPALDTLGLVHRVRLPPGDNPHPPLVMLHGLYGTEDVTWVFARAAGPQWLIISPRAPFAARDGFRWSDPRRHGSHGPDRFKVGSAALERFIEGLPHVYQADPARLTLLGFSQGAAMAYAYAATHRVRGVAALSGYIPPALAAKLPTMHHLPVLILHGAKDETVSIETARSNRDQLMAAEADVTYLESEVGHKVSSAGINALKSWLAERL